MPLWRFARMRRPVAQWPRFAGKRSWVVRAGSQTNGRLAQRLARLLYTQ